MSHQLDRVVGFDITRSQRKSASERAARLRDGENG